MVAHWIVIFAAIFATFTVITGLYASNLDHADSPYVLFHRNWGLITLVYTISHAILRIYVLRTKKAFSAYLFLLISLINLVLVAVTAEYGGMITREKGLFIQYLYQKHQGSQEHH